MTASTITGSSFATNCDLFPSPIISYNATDVVVHLYTFSNKTCLQEHQKRDKIIISNIIMETLTRAEADISLACRQFEHAFQNAKRVGNNSNFEADNKDSNAANFPNPIRMIRRLTTLELAMHQLRKDCETVARKRNGIVQTVVAQQSQNVADVEEVSFYVS
jgi:hypothetical protein